MTNGNITQQMHCKKSNNIIKTLSMTENIFKGTAPLHMLHILLSVYSEDYLSFS